MMLEQRLMDGLGHFAVLEDAENGGYMDSEETLTIQRARQDCFVLCEGIAAELLHPENSPAKAKAVIRNSFVRIGQATSTNAFTLDERDLIERYIAEIDQRIDRISSKPNWQRAFGRVYHRTPEFIRNWIFILILVAITFLVALALS